MPFSKCMFRLKLVPVRYDIIFILQIFVDKDTLMNSVSASHDGHLLKIDYKASKMIWKFLTNIPILRHSGYSTLDL